MIFGFDEFELDPDRLELRRAGNPIKADALVLRLLLTLVRQAGRLVTKEELIARVWDDRSVSENVITVTMTRLRRTLGQTSEREFVTNVHGRGYRFVRSVTEQDAQLAPIAIADASRRDSLPFVGREMVLNRLREAWRDAREGHGGVCILTGEPGIGKTRAVEQLAGEASAAGHPVAWGYCHPSDGTPPLWPFAQLVRDVLDERWANGTDDGRLRSLPELRRLRRLLPELESRTGDDRPKEKDGSLGLDPPKHQMFDAIMRVLVLAAERKPCVLVLDDLHGSDAASRYKDKPGVLGFEPINEPGWGTANEGTFSATTLTTFYSRVVARMRAAAPKALVFVDTTGEDGLALATMLGRPSGDGVVFAPHFYPSNHDPSSVEAGLKRWADIGASWNVPVFVGEFGLNDTSSTAVPFIAANFAAFDTLGLNGSEWEYSVSSDVWNSEMFGLVAADGSENPVAKAIQRPFARAVSGTAIKQAFNATTGAFTLTYMASGGVTEVSLPARAYPSGYNLTLKGACVDATSTPGRLLLQADADAGTSAVSLRIAPK